MTGRQFAQKMIAANALRKKKKFPLGGETNQNWLTGDTEATMVPNYLRQKALSGVRMYDDGGYTYDPATDGPSGNDLVSTPEDKPTGGLSKANAIASGISAMTGMASGLIKEPDAMDDPEYDYNVDEDAMDAASKADKAAKRLGVAAAAMAPIPVVGQIGAAVAGVGSVFSKWLANKKRKSAVTKRKKLPANTYQNTNATPLMSKYGGLVRPGYRR